MPERSSGRDGVNRRLLVLTVLTLLESSPVPKRALIIIDIQNDYFPGGKWTLSGIDAAADNAARVLDAARNAGDLVVHSTEQHLAGT